MRGEANFRRWHPLGSRQQVPGATHPATLRFWVNRVPQRRVSFAAKFGFSPQYIGLHLHDVFMRHALLLIPYALFLLPYDMLQYTLRTYVPA